MRNSGVFVRTADMPSATRRTVPRSTPSSDRRAARIAARPWERKTPGTWRLLRRSLLHRRASWFRETLSSGNWAHPAAVAEPRARRVLERRRAPNHASHDWQPHNQAMRVRPTERSALSPGFLRSACLHGTFVPAVAARGRRHANLGPEANGLGLGLATGSIRTPHHRYGCRPWEVVPKISPAQFKEAPPTGHCPSLQLPLTQKVQRMVPLCCEWDRRSSAHRLRS